MRRIIKISKMKKSKRKGDKVYYAEGYMVRFSVPKWYVERFGEELELEINEETGEIKLKPVKPEGRG